MTATRGRRAAGPWIVRAAIVLLLVSSSIRYFGKSSTADAIALWLFWAAVGVGVVGIGATAVSRWSSHSGREREDQGSGTSPPP